MIWKAASRDAFPGAGSRQGTRFALGHIGRPAGLGWRGIVMRARHAWFGHERKAEDARVRSPESERCQDV